MVMWNGLVVSRALEAVQAMIGSFEKSVSFEWVKFTSCFVGEDDQSQIRLHCDRNICIRKANNSSTVSRRS
jgi:hypothetical protein